MRYYPAPFDRDRVTLGADRVVSFIFVENEPSMRVAERNAMTRTKRLDENRLGMPIYVYAISRDDWETTRTT